MLQHDPQNVEALAGGIQCHISAGDMDGAKQLLGQVPDDLKTKPELVSIEAQLELAAEGAAVGSIPELMERLSRDQNDHQARFDLATALYGAGKRESAADELIEIVRRNRSWNEEAARKQLVKYFEAWGPSDPLTVDARRRLSALLFS